MTFKVTPAYLDELLNLVNAGDHTAFMSYLAPDVDWRVGASDEPGRGGSGTYTPERFHKFVVPVMSKMFEPGALVHGEQVKKVKKIIGHTAFVEDPVAGKLRNGQDYRNKSCVMVEFSADTGKIVKMHVYLDTAVRDAAMRSCGIEL